DFAVPSWVSFLSRECAVTYAAARLDRQSIGEMVVIAAHDDLTREEIDEPHRGMGAPRHRRARAREDRLGTIAAGGGRDRSRERRAIRGGLPGPVRRPGEDRKRLTPSEARRSAAAMHAGAKQRGALDPEWKRDAATHGPGRRRPLGHAIDEHASDPAA